MIKPRELESDKGRDLWDTIRAAAAGEGSGHVEVAEILRRHETER
jgi:hypothetical protein